MLFQFLYIFSLMLVLSSSAIANLKHIPGQDHWQVICAFEGGLFSGEVENLRPARLEMLKVIELILEQVGMESNFTVFEGDFKYSGIAFATIQDGQRMIVYDAKIFAIRTNQVEWASLTIIAHEIGHHLRGDVSADVGPQKLQELGADYFSGWIAARLNATLEQALNHTSLINKEGGKTHPSRKRRQAVVKQGWLASKQSEN